MARGPARIVENTLQAKHIRKGDVIVSDTNDIVAVCGRERIAAAVAIITDSASEVSQLSQLSHELHVPCVAGTTYGTQVIYEGLQVMVDATGGPGIRYKP